MRVTSLPEGMVLRFTSDDGWSTYVIEPAKKPCIIPKLPLQRGYARFCLKMDGRTAHFSCHREAWKQAYGDIPKGMVIDHLCLNKSCCEPSHLDCVTHKVNTRRWSVLITHCPQGHEYTAENTIINRVGAKGCRTCKLARTREAKQRDPNVQHDGKGCHQRAKLVCPKCGGDYSPRSGKGGGRRCMTCARAAQAARYATPEGRAKQIAATAKYQAKKKLGNSPSPERK